eukprot:8093552-Alexandrium_andersonii.AAC.1
MCTCRKRPQAPGAPRCNPASRGGSLAAAQCRSPSPCRPGRARPQQGTRGPGAGTAACPPCCGSPCWCWGPTTARSPARRK